MESERFVEVRLIALVVVDVSHPSMADAIRSSVGQSVAAIVASELVSGLESVDYVDAVITSEV